MSEDKLAEQFKAYVSHQIPEAQGIEIGFMNPIFGGASRHTYSVELNYTLDGGEISQRVILRLEATSGIVDTRTKTEWDACLAFYGTDVPVPRPIWLEEDAKWLGSPFIVVEEITGCQDSHYYFMQPPYDALREKIGETFCKIMGAIHLTDPASVGLENKLEVPAPDQCWSKELDYWEAEANKHELEPHPVLRAAIRWLRRNPPPPARKVGIVHGDMRAGNFLYNEKGEIRAILDWEMMHMGDPLEDLAWSMNRVFYQADPDRIMGLLLSRQQAVNIWQETTGFKVNPASLFWWEVFSSVKGMAIWISMSKTYATGATTDPTICFGGLMATDIQDRILIDQMREARQ